MINNKDIEKLSCVSYNLFWEIMDYENAVRLIKIKKDLPKYKEYLLHNINSVLDYYNPQILCFQEASNFKNIVDLFDHNFDHVVNKSNLENMITIWNKNKIKLISFKSNEFEKGRPFCIFIFKHKILKYNFMLINIHASHNDDTENALFKPIQNIINTFDNTLLKNIHRVLIVGDFNRNVNNEIKNKLFSYSLLINKIKYQFHNNNNNKNTCCDMYGNNLIKNYDHVIDTLNNPLVIHPLNNEKWYKYPSSDHVMILSILDE
jgi:hypothetical protein